MNLEFTIVYKIQIAAEEIYDGDILNKQES